MTKIQKPIVHGRDHERGGADPFRMAYESVGEAGGGGAASFALTGGPFNVDSGNQILDTPSPDVMHFSTTDMLTYDMSTDGRARILRPGLYVTGCQVNVQTGAVISSETVVVLSLKYEGDIGYSIEIPYIESGLGASGGQQILGTRWVYPAATVSGFDVALQRVHPLSVDDTATYPIEIHPTVVTNAGTGQVTATWLGLWGWRLGEPLGSYHSD